MSDVSVAGADTHCTRGRQDEMFKQTRLVVGVPWFACHSGGNAHVVVAVHWVSVVAVAWAIWYWLELRVYIRCK